jgi:hypothetical protein
MLYPRTYEPGGVLFAQVPLRFAGVDYARGAELPAMHRDRHRALFVSGKASHLKFGLFDRRGRLRKPAPAVVQAAPPSPKKRTARASR